MIIDRVVPSDIATPKSELEEEVKVRIVGYTENFFGREFNKACDEYDRRNQARAGKSDAVTVTADAKPSSSGYQGVAAGCVAPDAPASVPRGGCRGPFERSLGGIEMVVMGNNKKSPQPGNH